MVLIFPILLAINLGLAIFLASYVFYQNPSNPLNRLTLLLCLMYCYEIIDDLGLSLTVTSDSALFWFKVGSFSLLIVVFQLHFALFFAKQSTILRSKVFYIVIYGYAAVFTGIDLFTNLVIGDVLSPQNLLIGSTWINLYPENELLSVFRGIIEYTILGITVVVCVIRLLQERDESQRQQAFYVTFGMFLLVALTPYASALGLLLICYGVSRFGVGVFTPVLSAEIIMDHLPEVLIMVNPSGKVQFANQAAVKALGYTNQEIVGLSFERMTIPHPPEQSHGQMSTIIRNSGHVHDFGMIFKAKDGHQVPLSVSIAEVRRRRGKYVGLLYLGWDAEPMQKRERELSKLQQELQEECDAKTSYLATEASEIQVANQNILESLRAILAKSRSTLPDAQQRKFNTILANAEAIDVIGQEMRELSEQTGDYFSPNRQDISIKDLLESTLDLFQDDARQQDVMLVKEVPNDVGIISADKRMITQVVYNLLNNAVKYTPGGGQVGVRVRRTPDGVEIIIWDTGVGIAKKDMEKLFRPYKT
ncbi:MAG TPA: PAS domain S-box protein, partial [Candidatus Lokiarchaeia archaeon]|nr:PAS domain S-box protein [Candidatus Lokiarchaeia archaeon]